jgi:hypothetical protein
MAIAPSAESTREPSFIPLETLPKAPRWKTFRRVIVDTGAEMTWLPEVDLRSAGVETFKTRHVGMAVIECGEFKTVDEVVFAQPGDLSLLGARSLAGFNAQVDSRRVVRNTASRR